MIRTFSLAALFLFAFCVVPGCGTNAPEFDESKTTAQTDEEIQEAEDYSKMLEEQYKETTTGSGASQ